MKIIVWSLVLAVSILFAGNRSLMAEETGLQKVTLKVDGISCGSCLPKIRKALSNLPGVTSAEVTADRKWIFFTDKTARAVVEFESSQTNVEALIKAVEGSGDAISEYTATVIESVIRD